jgi:hypothetical protein
MVKIMGDKENNWRRIAEDDWRLMMDPWDGVLWWDPWGMYRGSTGNLGLPRTHTFSLFYFVPSPSPIDSCGVLWKLGLRDSIFPLRTGRAGVAGTMSSPELLVTEPVCPMVDAARLPSLPVRPMRLPQHYVLTSHA